MPGASPSRRPTDRRGIARHGRLHRKRPLTTLLRGVGVVLAVLLVSGASLGAMTYGHLKSQITTVSLGTKNDRAAAGQSISAIKGGANILLVGSDTRVGQNQVHAGVADGSRNDVTMLIHLSADHSQMTVVSFPRDLMVDKPQCAGTGGATFPAADYQQFNTTLGEGLGCTVATVESMTGLSIPYAAEITFDGVIEMSNAIGGVDVCVAQPISDSDSGLVLSKGTHTLAGLQALEFLRTRHGVGDGSDLARISSQQVYLSAMMRKIVSSGTLGSPLKLYGLASAATKNMTLSTSLGETSTMVQLGLALKGIDLSKVIFVQYPSVDDPQDSNRVVPDTTNAAILDNDLRTDTKFTIGSGSLGRASTSEGSGSSGSTATDAAPTSPATPSSTPSTTASPSAAPTALPSTITGQSASQETCSVGNG